MTTATDWIARFEGLSRLAPDLRQTLAHGSHVVSVPAGTAIFAPGQPARDLLLLLDGTVRVSQKSDTGREVFLYRVHAGESCVLTTACMLAFEDYAAEGVAESDVRAATVPRAVFEDLVARSPDFREFIFRAYSRRIVDLFALIEAIVFRRMDVRLAERLLELADGTGTVRATHQTLANELGTAREVISRILSEFQRSGWVESGRGEVRIVAREGLVRLSRTAGDR